VKKGYEYIVFDLGNTLIRFDHNISANKIAKRFNTDAKKIYDMFFDSDITRLFERGKLSPAEFHVKASRFLGLDISYDDFTGIWNDIFWEDDGMCALARELKDRYKLILLSNINVLHFEHIADRFNIIKIFDDLVLSYLVGSAKPEREIFDEVIKRARGNRTGILYIDDREDLVAAALDLGIDSVRFEGVDKLRETMREKGILA